MAHTHKNKKSKNCGGCACKSCSRIGCNECSCACGFKSTQHVGPKTPEFEQILRTSGDVDVPGNITQVHVSANEDSEELPKITLPDNARDGQRITIVACDTDVKVVLSSGKHSCHCDDDDEDEDDVAIVCAGSTREAVFSQECDCKWILDNGKKDGCPKGDGYICVKDLAELKELDVTKCESICTRALVKTLDAMWTLDKENEYDEEFLNKTGPTVCKAKGGGFWLRNITFSKRWAALYTTTQAHCNLETGNDENDGTTVDTPVKHVAEICQRLAECPQGKNVTVNVYADVSNSDDDTLTPMFLREHNVADVLQGGSGDGQTSPFNISFVFVPKAPIATGTIETFTATDKDEQSTVVVSAASIALVNANRGRLMRVTSGLAIGAILAIGFVDLGTRMVRVSDSGNASATPANLAGASFEIINNLKWAPPIQQFAASQTRGNIIGALFPAIFLPPPDNNRASLNSRTVNITFAQCVFERPLQFDLNTGSTIANSSIVLPINDDGTRAVVPAVGGAFTFLRTLCLDCDLRFTNAVGLAQMFALYLEGSTLQTRSFQSATYGATLAVRATNGCLDLVIGGANPDDPEADGLSIYNWPATADGSRIGLLLIDQTRARCGSGFRGRFDGATPAGAVGCFIESGSEFGVATNITPTITGDLAGTGAEVRIDNNIAGGSADLAVRALQVGGANDMGITVAGAAVTMDAQVLRTWANWADTAANDGFERHAFNPHHGGRVYNAPL